MPVGRGPQRLFNMGHSNFATRAMRGNQMMPAQYWQQFLCNVGHSAFFATRAMVDGNNPPSMPWRLCNMGHGDFKTRATANSNNANAMWAMATLRHGLRRLCNVGHGNFVMRAKMGNRTAPAQLGHWCHCLEGNNASATWVTAPWQRGHQCQRNMVDDADNADTVEDSAAYTHNASATNASATRVLLWGWENMEEDVGGARL